MQFIFEIIFYAIAELIVEVFGVGTRYFVLKIFNKKIKFEEFSNRKSGWHKLYNALVGLVILIGLIFGVAFIVFHKQ